jgi:hypothetical protein
MSRFVTSIIRRLGPILKPFFHQLRRPAFIEAGRVGCTLSAKSMDGKAQDDVHQFFLPDLTLRFKALPHLRVKPLNLAITAGASSRTYRRRIMRLDEASIEPIAKITSDIAVGSGTADVPFSRLLPLPGVETRRKPVPVINGLSC